MALFGAFDARLPIVVDDAAEQIRTLAAKEDPRFIGRELLALNDIIVKAVPRPTADVVGSLEAAQYLDRCIAATESTLLDRHRGYSRLRWLWYLRRLPDAHFKGDHPSTLGYDRTLAESLTALVDSNDERAASVQPLRYPVDSAVCRQILRLVAGIKFLSQLHVLARLAGKRASFKPAGATPLDVIRDTVPRAAIDTYDQRLTTEDARLFAGLGLTQVPLSMDAADAAGMDVVRLIRCEPYTVSTTVHDGTQLREVNISAQYTVERVSPSQLLLPFNAPLPQVPTPEAMALIMFQMASALLFTRADASRSSLLRLGYALVDEPFLLHLLADALPLARDRLHTLGYRENLPGNERAWLRSLGAIRPQLWPMVRGGFVRRFRDQVAIDLAMSSQAVIDLFRAKRLSGTVGKQRGNQFEINLQARIDETPWRPPVDLQETRGRTLRNAGEKITDVDAFAALDRTLVLVSCKSLIYDADYDAGRFAVINKGNDTVAKAVAEWKDNVRIFRLSRKGDNYDFSAYDDFIGVVCTPFAPYTNDAAALEFVRPDLRASSSASELIAWLRANG